MTSRPLFGGAITALIPRHYLDASDLRQIPDNQEVFLSPDSDTSLVIEILGMVEEGDATDDLWQAAQYHFNSIAHDNSALSSTLISATPSTPTPSRPQTTQNPMTPPPITLCGKQIIHKFSHNPTGAPRPGHENDAPDIVWICLALWRCWVVPPGSSSRKKADVVMSVNVNLSVGQADEGERERLKVEEWFKQAVQSFSIDDWGLFGDSE